MLYRRVGVNQLPLHPFPLPSAPPTSQGSPDSRLRKPRSGHAPFKEEVKHRSLIEP